MREIKFRAWDTDFKRMLPVHDAEFVNGTMIGAKGINWDTRVVVMQYTGLKDKNGKEIFEGDLIKSPYEEIMEVDDPILGDFIYIEYHEMGHTYITEVCEVIGNIYENPELLK